MSTVIYKDRDFLQTAARMIVVADRTMAEQLNRMAYFSARAACRNTAKVSKEQILAELNAEARISNAPLAAILVQRGRKPGLYGAELAAAVKKFIAGRVRSRAFLASGWLPAIKQLASLVPQKAGAAQIGPGIRQFGGAKGGGRAASKSNLIARIWNTAGAKTESGRKALDSKVLPALEAAVAEETGKSKAYIERKMAEAWRGAGAKVH